MPTIEEIKAIIARRQEREALVAAGESEEMAKVLTDPDNVRAYHHLEGMSLEEFEKNLESKWWRMNNLYYIINKEGKKVLFKCNVSQKKLYCQIWYRNIILKARQRGFTTFIDLYILDECLFNENIEAGIIAHTKGDATKIFRKKVLFPYENLPKTLQNYIKLKKQTSEELIFANGSSISVTVSLRSNTAQYLHVSEFGKICAKYPEKAREIVTGALEAVAKGMFVFIESTAEGRSGYFHDYCKTAQDLQKLGKKLSPLDFSFFFSPWWEDPDYSVAADFYEPIATRIAEYFEELESIIGRKLTLGQKSWWVKKNNILGDDMKREYPATPEEAFLAVLLGAYFASEFTKIRKEKRITRVPYDPSLLVYTWWDLGMNDTMAIWFSQDAGREIHLIDYYENSGEGFGFYADVLNRRGYRYGSHWGPHDLKVRELGTGISRVKAAKQLGITFNVVPRVKDKQDNIQAARSILPICWFDEEKTETGYTHLESYRKEWDEHLQTYKRTPLHDEHSNGADAFQTMAQGRTRHLKIQTQKAGIGAPPSPPPPAGGWT